MWIISNIDGKLLELGEKQEFSAHGKYGKVIKLKGISKTKISGSIFTSRNRRSGRSSIIHIFVDGTKYPRCLLPEIFQSYSHLVFELNHEVLIISGIHPKPWYNSFSLWGYGTEFNPEDVIEIPDTRIRF